VEPRIRLDDSLVTRARECARAIADDVWQHIDLHTTDSVERACLRLLDVEGVNKIDVPLVNVVVEHGRELLPGGIVAPFVDLMMQSGKDAQQTAEAIAAGALTLQAVPAERRAAVGARAVDLAAEGIARLDAVRRTREEMIDRLGSSRMPWAYVMVATGNIYEDVIQAKAAARAGADVIAVIRTTAQSLLDYVPYGETTEGFAGTYATQENFRLMRAGLDEVSEEVGRYVLQCSYASGLCMPEIAYMGARERLDVILNDSMYGIVFRDINMQRTFVDQYLSRMINARAGMMINTGEENYLTTTDQWTKGHTVITSDFINEEFAYRAGLKPWQMGVAHAFQMDPALPNQVVYQIADALLVRQLFPEAPLKYQPPTKYISGDIFTAHVIDAMYNFTGVFTGQGSLCLAMLSEASHTPLMQDRYLSIKNAKYVFEACRDLSDQFVLKPDSLIQKRADELLSAGVAQLERIAQIGLFKALEQGEFADVVRHPEGGRGLDGVLARTRDYFNPFYDALRDGLASGSPGAPKPWGTDSACADQVQGKEGRPCR
jgi:beta-lysine 5,6-aminomutase alpha subunit